MEDPKVKTLEAEITTLKSQVEKVEADKKKAEAELATLKASSPTVPTQLSDDKLKPAFEDAAKKYLEELKAYFTADKFAALFSPVPPATATGATVSEVATTPGGTIVYTPADKLRTFPYESTVKVTFQFTGSSPITLELPGRADSSGVWVFPPAQEVESRLRSTVPRSAATSTTTTNTGTTTTQTGGSPPGPPATNSTVTTTTTTTTATNSPPIVPTSNAPSSGKAPRKGEAKTMDSH